MQEHNLAGAGRGGKAPIPSRVVPKNWVEFQHYKNRRPPWIKLHRQLLDDQQFARMPLSGRALAPMIWLLASEESGGIIQTDGIAWRLRCSQAEVEEGIAALLEAGFLLDASNMLAPCKQHASAEERRGEESRDTMSEGVSECASARERGAAAPPPEPEASQPSSLAWMTPEQRTEAIAAMDAALVDIGVYRLSKAKRGKIAVSLVEAGDSPANLEGYLEAVRVKGDPDRSLQRLCGVLRDTDRANAINDHVCREEAKIRRTR